MVAAEAAAAGTASIVTDRCGVAEVLRDRGALVDPVRRRAPARGARPAARRRRRSASGSAVAGREVAAELSWANVARLQAELYERVA